MKPWRTPKSPRVSRKISRLVKPARSHLLEQMGVVAADFQLGRLAFDLDQLTPAKVTRDADDRLHIHDRGAMDLPEKLGVEFVDQFLDRLADQGLVTLGLDPRVLLVGGE